MSGPPPRFATMADLLAPNYTPLQTGYVPPPGTQYTRGQVQPGYMGPTRNYYNEDQLLQAGTQGARVASRIWTNPSADIGSKPYQVVGTTPDTIYSGPTEASRSSQALQQLQWSELSKWGPAVPERGGGGVRARAAVAQMELSVSADDNIGGDNVYGFSGNPGTFGIAYFPVVYRFTAAGSITQGSTGNIRDVRVVPFAVVASSQPWTGTYIGGIQPQYVPIQAPDLGNGTVQLMLDVNYCKNDTNLVLSVLASVLSFLPGRWASAAQGGSVQCFLTIAPAISQSDVADFHTAACTFVREDPNQVHPRQSMAFGGASLGLAVAAAICGLPPMLYTGYLSSMGMDHVFYGQRTSSDALRVGIPLQALSKVILGATFVESVDDVPYKVNYAINVGMPIVIPLNPTWTHARPVEDPSGALAALRAARSNKNTAARQESLVKRAMQAAGLPMSEIQSAMKVNFALTMADYIMTVSKLAGGKSFIEVGSLVMAASNYADARMLACKYAGYCYGGYNNNIGNHYDDMKKYSGSIAQQLEAKGLIRTMVERDINKDKGAQRKVAKAQGNPILKPKPKKQAENAWMAKRKEEQKAKAKAAQQADAALKKTPEYKQFMAAQRAAAKVGGKASVAAGASGAFKGGKAGGKVAAKGKVKGDAAGLMRASKASRMEFLKPMTNSGGLDFVAATTKYPTLQHLAFKTRADAYRASMHQAAPQAVGGAAVSDAAVPESYAAPAIPATPQSMGLGPFNSSFGGSSIGKPESEGILFEGAPPAFSGAGNRDYSAMMRNESGGVRQRRTPTPAELVPTARTELRELRAARGIPALTAADRRRAAQQEWAAIQNFDPDLFREI